MLYFDYAATTPLRVEVILEMEKFLTNEFANPHSLHQAGVSVKFQVEQARERIAASIGASPRQIVFTSGGTEGNNLAILGAARARRRRGRHLLTIPIEHQSVLGSVEALTEEGFEADLVDINLGGQVIIESLQELLRDDTVLVSIGHANNEIGVVQDVSEIADLAHRKGALIHSDAVQSFGKLKLNIKELGVDLLTVSGHKIYGPKGIGFLFIGNGVRLEPLMYGGEQERGFRPGTLNVPAIMGLAKAVELAVSEQAAEYYRLNELKEQLINEGCKLPGVSLNGSRDSTLPHIVNLSAQGLEGQAIASELSKQGIAISSGSACTSTKKGPSHVLMALHNNAELAATGFRISLGRQTTTSDIVRLIDSLAKALVELHKRFS